MVLLSIALTALYKALFLLLCRKLEIPSQVQRYRMVGYGTNVRVHNSGSFSVVEQQQQGIGPSYILFIGLLILAQLMQSYASCLLSNLLRCCSCLLCLLSCASLFWSYCYFPVSACPQFVHVLGFATSLYSTYLAVYAGVACLCCACLDSMSDFPNL